MNLAHDTRIDSFGNDEDITMKSSAAACASRVAPAKARKPCHPKVRRALLRAMGAALERSVIFLPLIEETEITPCNAHGAI